MANPPHLPPDQPATGMTQVLNLSPPLRTLLELNHQRPPSFPIGRDPANVYNSMDGFLTLHAQ